MRIKWIDGLKGLASLMIFFHHFVLAFIPALYYGNTVKTNLFTNEGSLADSPFLFFVGGHFLVSLFLMLSGLVLSLQVYRIESIKELLSKIITRYLRLALPVFIISLIVYIMMRFGLFYHNSIFDQTGSPWLQLFYQIPIGLKSVFETSFYSVWFVGNDTFSTAFWMLTHLFYGSLLTYGVIYLIRNHKPSFQLILILIVFLITTVVDSYLVNFTYGMLLAWMIQHNIDLIRNKMIVSMILISGIFLAGFPQGVQPTNFYSIFLFLNGFITASIHIHALGAFLMILGIKHLKQFMSILECSYLQMLGRISYSIYLVHIPLLFSFSTYLFTIINHYSLNYGISIFIVFVTSLAFLLLISWLFEKYLVAVISKYTKTILTL